MFKEPTGHMPRRGLLAVKETINMNRIGKFLTLAVVAIGLGVSNGPSASACGNQVMTQPAVIENTLLNPAMIDSCGTQVLTQPAVIDSCDTQVLTQPAVIDSCNTQVLTQPAVIDNSCNTCQTMPVVIEGKRDRHHLLHLGTPLFNFNLL